MRKFLQPFIPAAFLVIAALVMSSSPVAAKSLTVDVAREEMGDPELSVSVVAVRGLWRSDTDSPQNGSP